MRKINKMIAMVMLAVMVSFGTQTAFADPGVLVSDRHATPRAKPMSSIDILIVYMKTGVIVDTRNDLMLDD